MDNHLILQIIEILFALAGAVFGAVELTKRKKLTIALKSITQAFPGDVAQLYESCKWGWVSARDAHNVAIKLSDSPEKESLLRLINQATYHSQASEKMSVNLFSQLLAFQEAQFSSRAINHPLKDTLELCIAELNNQK